MGAKVPKTRTYKLFDSEELVYDQYDIISSGSSDDELDGENNNTSLEKQVESQLEVITEKFDEESLSLVETATPKIISTEGQLISTESRIEKDITEIDETAASNLPIRTPMSDYKIRGRVNPEIKAKNIIMYDVETYKDILVNAVEIYHPDYLSILKLFFSSYNMDTFLRFCTKFRICFSKDYTFGQSKILCPNATFPTYRITVIEFELLSVNNLASKTFIDTLIQLSLYDYSSTFHNHGIVVRLRRLKEKFSANIKTLEVLYKCKEGKVKAIHPFVLILIAYKFHNDLRHKKLGPDHLKKVYGDYIMSFEMLKFFDTECNDACEGKIEL